MTPQLVAQNKGLGSFFIQQLIKSFSSPVLKNIFAGIGISIIANIANLSLVKSLLENILCWSNIMLEKLKGTYDTSYKDAEYYEKLNCKSIANLALRDIINNSKNNTEKNNALCKVLIYNHTDIIAVNEYNWINKKFECDTNKTIEQICQDKLNIDPNYQILMGNFNTTESVQ